MSSPESDWSIISHHEKQKEGVRRQQEMLYEQAASAANLSSARRLGTARTHYQMETSDPEARMPSPPPASSKTAPVQVPATSTGSSRRGSKKPPPSAFPTTTFPKTEDDEKVEPPKGNSFVRKVRTSLLGGRNPFTAQNKNGSKEKQDPVAAPVAQSPEPDAVMVPRPDTESNIPQMYQTAAPPPKQPRARPPPITAYTRPSYASQPYNNSRSSSTTPGPPSSREASTPELVHVVTPEPPASKSREIPIVELPSARVADQQRDPVLGALQTHRSAPGKAIYAPTKLGHVQSDIRPLPKPPTMPPKQPTSTPSTSRSYQVANPVSGTTTAPLPVPAATPVLPSAPVPSPEPVHPPPTTSTRSHHRESSSSQAHTSSSPPVVRYHTHTSSNRTSRASRTSYATTATTPSLSSSRTHASSSDTPAPPRDMERTAWATAPATHPLTSTSGRNRAASVDQIQVPPNDAWNDSLAEIHLRSNQPMYQHEQKELQVEYRPETTSSRRDTAPPPTNHATRPLPNKLQRQATAPASAPPTTVTYVYYDTEPPLISQSSRLSDLKEDYRNPGSERSEIIRRKINYLRFELGYTSLRRSRGDGNCFYRSFAFAYLTQIYCAEDRAVAVISALEHLEVAQNYVDLAIPNHPLSRMYPYVQGLIRGMELRTVDQKSLLKVFQRRQESNDIVAYVRLITSAYIRLTPEMHASIFHPDDPTIVISAPDFCSIFVERLGEDADHIQISALSRALNASVYIYRLDDRIDLIDGYAPNDLDVAAHCTRFLPPDIPPVTDPVTLLFRPGHYDILERDRAPR